MYNYKIILPIVLGLLFNACKPDEVDDTPFASIMVDVTNFMTDKGGYMHGEDISCSFKLHNKSNADLTLTDISISVDNLSNTEAPEIHKVSVGDNISIKSNEYKEFSIASFYSVPDTLPAGTSCGISLICSFEDNIHKAIKVSFIRVIDDQVLTTYRVDREVYQELDVFLLSGGMSAEFGVQKTLASFANGISHSWQKGNGGGPKPVMMTPDFIPLSLKKTVDMYNEVLGENTPVKTVIIGTGVPSVSYLSNALKAPYLPIHFLGSANTAQEVQAVLDYSNDQGYPSYATLGYDGSMAGVGVAWIKLLDLPNEYKQFLIDHQVEEVILFGVGEKVIGESYARKVLTANRTVEYGPRSLYIQYTQYGSAGDVAALSARIYDFKSLQLDNNRLIADWESGILDRQIDNFATSIGASTNAVPYSLSCTNDMIALYNLASNITVGLIKKNESVLGSPYVKGVAFNEYLVCQPLYELVTAYVPLLYWQFVPVESTISRAMNIVKPAIKKYYPAINFNSLKFFLNSGYKSAALKDELVENGIPASSITIRGDQIVWDLSDGMIAPSEVTASNIINDIGLNNFKTTLNAIKPLTIEEIEDVCKSTSGCVFLRK